jgi:hypothetical protein
LLPVGLAEMPPGPALSAALGSIDRSVLSGFDLVVVLRARGRQLVFEQAELAAHPRTHVVSARLRPSDWVRLRAAVTRPVAALLPAGRSPDAVVVSRSPGITPPEETAQ